MFAVPVYYVLQLSVGRDYICVFDCKGSPADAAIHIKMLIAWMGYVYTCTIRVATVREKVLENEKFSRSGKSQEIAFSVREI